METKVKNITQKIKSFFFNIKLKTIKRASMMHTTKGGLFTLTANVAPRIIYRGQADWSVFKDAIEANPTTPLSSTSCLC